MTGLNLARASAALVLVTGITLQAAPAAAALQDSLKAACAADTRKLCPEHAGEPDQLKACLLAHRDRVNPACSKVINTPG